ncbi:MAG: HAD-IA family hydrolase [Nitrospirae bacterium]|nr:HAD-IA family hydrolase [Candidatus Manganitrophaceae bacterium]
MNRMVCLDLDGTLEDSRRDMISAVRRVREALQLPHRTDKEILPWINKGMEPLYRACFDDYLQADAARFEEVRRRYEADYLENVTRETQLYSGIAEVLPKLAKLAPLIVVTNKPERISRRLLEVLRIDQFFADIIGGDTCAATKPDPLLLEEAAWRCGFDPEKGCAVMIGDTAGDIQMGRAFGAKTIWCAWGYVSEPGERPDLIAPDPAVLPALVQMILDKDEFPEEEACDLPAYP